MKTVYQPAYCRLVGRLKVRRVAAGLDQATVAARLGHTNRWLSKVERMDIRIDVVQFILLCRVLGLRSGRLIRRLEQEVSPDEGEPLLSVSKPGFWVEFANLVRRLVRRGSYRVVFIAFEDRFKS